jgi:phosphate transport system protein
MKGDSKVSVREKFEDELTELQEKMMSLVQFTDRAFAKAMEAFQTHNIDLALKVMEEDTKANILYEEINDFAILLIAKQQPVAIDLRRIMVSIKIATDLERMADFAVNVAKSTIRIGQEPHIKEANKLKKMYEISSVMLKEALIAYQQEELFILNNEKGNYDQLVQMLFICRYLERYADHITNITEYIFYMVKGKHYDLNE